MPKHIVPPKVVDPPAPKSYKVIDDLRDGDHFAAALAMIATGELPCRKCGQTHHAHPVPGKAPSWADMMDGHGYQRMPADEFAQRVLGLVE